MRTCTRHAGGLSWRAPAGAHQRQRLPLRAALPHLLLHRGAALGAAGRRTHCGGAAAYAQVHPAHRRLLAARQGSAGELVSWRAALVWVVAGATALQGGRPRRAQEELGRAPLPAWPRAPWPVMARSGCICSSRERKRRVAVWSSSAAACSQAWHSGRRLLRHMAAAHGAGGVLCSST